VFGVLRELVAVAPAGVAEHVSSLVPGILQALNVGLSLPPPCRHYWLRLLLLHAAG
jgi:hypothetical protein